MSRDVAVFLNTGDRRTTRRLTVAARWRWHRVAHLLRLAR